MMLRIGNRSRLALELEWSDCPPLADDGQRATFAFFSVWCQGNSLTRNVDSLGEHEAVLVPASSVALWIAEHLVDIIANERLWGAADAADAHEHFAALAETDWDEHEDELDAWFHAHNLLEVGDGLLLPSVMFMRRGDDIIVSWRNDPQQRAVNNRWIQFLPGKGNGRIPIAEAREVLTEFVVRVASKASTNATEESLARERLGAAVSRWDDPESDLLSILAARVGRDVGAMKKEYGGTDARSAASKIAKDYGLGFGEPEPWNADSAVAMAARSAGPSWSAEDHRALVALGKTLDLLESPQGVHAVKGLTEARLISKDSYSVDEDTSASDKGYARAAHLRAILNNERDCLDIEQQLLEWGCVIKTIELEDTLTDGVALWSAAGKALIAVNEKSLKASRPWGRRALLAHETYHLLFDASEKRAFGEGKSGKEPHVNEAVANAFAAELLLPRAALPTESELEAASGDLDAMKKIARSLCEDYKVGFELAVRQLQNRRGLRRDLVDALLEERG